MLSNSWSKIRFLQQPDKILELVDLRLSSMKNKKKRARPELDDELLEKITDKELRKHIPDDERIDQLFNLCKVLVTLPDAKKGDKQQIFGKNVKNYRVSDKLKK